MRTTPLAPPTRRVVGHTHRVLADGTRVHLCTCPVGERMCDLGLHRAPRTASGSPASTMTTCRRRGLPVRRARRAGTSTRIPTDCGSPWCAMATRFVGNPVGHSCSLGRYGALRCSTSPHISSSAPLDEWPSSVTGALRYGNMSTIPAPDTTRTDCLVIMGASPRASGGSLVAWSDELGDAIPARGATIIVVDPRRTGTAARADVVNVLTRHLDVEGGLPWGAPVRAPLASRTDTDGTGEPRFGRWRVRVPGAAEMLAQVPASCLAEAIATPGPGQITALSTVTANLGISATDAGRLTAALPGFDHRRPERMVALTIRMGPWGDDWTRSIAALVKGKDRCALRINPDDARAATVVDGGRARVSREVGRVEVPVEVVSA